MVVIFPYIALRSYSLIVGISNKLVPEVAIHLGAKSPVGIRIGNKQL